MNRIQKALEKVPDVFTSYEGRLLCQPIRQCAVTNVLLPKSFLIRLVIAQSQYGNVLVPDIGERFPGRGIWVCCDKEVVNKLVQMKSKRKAFFYKGNQQLIVSENLETVVEKRIYGEILNILKRIKQNQVSTCDNNEIIQSIREYSSKPLSTRKLESKDNEIRLVLPSQNSSLPDLRQLDQLIRYASEKNLRTPYMFEPGLIRDSDLSAIFDKNPIEIVGFREDQLTTLLFHQLYRLHIYRNS